MRDEEIIYTTGLTPGGLNLVGGIWTLWDQHGFPLEMSHLICRDSGWHVDWIEAMADASLSNNLPALMKQVEAFLDTEMMLAMKTGFIRALNSGKNYEQIVADKRANGVALGKFIEEAKSRA